MATKHPNSPATPPARANVTHHPGELNALAEMAIEDLYEADPQIADLLLEEHRYQSHTLNLLAASSPADPSTAIAGGISFPAVTAEGYPGRRFHSGAMNVDALEDLAVTRAKRLFTARHANVQPHSGSSANLAVAFSVLNPGDTILGLHLDSGGHLTHGARASITGKYFRTAHYGLDASGKIDLEQVRTKALQYRPRLIICGASAYPRRIDFAAFREIADEVGALLLADISHIAGLVVAGEHPSPIDIADFTTTSTYKQLRGPRGGLILLGERDTDAAVPPGDAGLTWPQSIDKSVFPGTQGTPSFANIAAKCVAFEKARRPSFSSWVRKVVHDANLLAAHFSAAGLGLLTYGTDTHLLVVDLRDNLSISGYLAEKALERCGFLANRNRVPNDHRSAYVASGLRIGTNHLAARELSDNDVLICAETIVRILFNTRAISDTTYELDCAISDEAAAIISSICARNPLRTL
ncbi:MAG: serine hydroxymethyltransferase [Mycobacterium sp.]